VKFTVTLLHSKYPFSIHPTIVKNVERRPYNVIVSDVLRHINSLWRKKTLAALPLSWNACRLLQVPTVQKRRSFWFTVKLQRLGRSRISHPSYPSSSYYKGLGLCRRCKSFTTLLPKLILTLYIWTTQHIQTLLYPTSRTIWCSQSIGNLDWISFNTIPRPLKSLWTPDSNRSVRWKLTISMLRYFNPIQLTLICRTIQS
jgi:hypothetical protein